MNERLGETRLNKQGTIMKIVRYGSYDDIDIEFMKKPNRFGLPNGIEPLKSGKYNASYRGEPIGKFDTLELAVAAHDREKQKALIKLANEYKNKIPNKLYEALINWKPNYHKCD